jgi:hypothetical protein
MPASSRFLVSLIVVALVAIGCTPADPLEWKVYAKTPAYFEAWRTENLSKAPPAIQKEFNHAFDIISSMRPRALALAPGDLHKTGNLICEHLHRRRLRSVILEGYQLETRALNARISTLSDKLIENLKRSTQAADPGLQQRFEKVQNSQKADLAQMEARLKEIERRTNELAR